MAGSGTGVELLTGDEQTLVGTIGLGITGALGLVAAWRVIRFLACYRCDVLDIFSNVFSQKRFAIHVLIVLSLCFVAPMYVLLIWRRQVCTGLLALQRLQFFCIYTALALILGDWRIDVYESPITQTKRLTYYQIRDWVTGVLLSASFLINVTGPWFCLEEDWASQEGYIDADGGTEAGWVDAAYLVQLLCALVLMLSMLYSGLQMKKRLVWASRSPLRQNDMFRTALRQLNMIMVVCIASFLCQLITLAFNYVQLMIWQRSLISSVVLWALGVWLPSTGWSLACLYLARKARRMSFAYSTPRPSRHVNGSSRQRELVEVLLSEEERAGDDAGSCRGIGAALGDLVGDDVHVEAPLTHGKAEADCSNEGVAAHEAHT